MWAIVGVTTAIMLSTLAPAQSLPTHGLFLPTIALGLVGVVTLGRSVILRLAHGHVASHQSSQVAPADRPAEDGPGGSVDRQLRNSVDTLVTWLYRREYSHQISPIAANSSPAPATWARRLYDALGLGDLGYQPPRPIGVEPGFRRSTWPEGIVIFYVQGLEMLRALDTRDWSNQPLDDHSHMKFNEWVASTRRMLAKDYPLQLGIWEPFGEMGAGVFGGRNLSFAARQPTTPQSVVDLGARIMERLATLERVARGIALNPPEE